MKLSLALLLMIFSAVVFAQDRLFFGRVVDENNNGIPNAIVEVKDRNDGTFCYSDGVFSFYTNTDSVTSLIFSSQGYYPKEISLGKISSDSLIVRLEPKPVLLPELSVHAKKHRKKSRELILGRKHLKCAGGCYMRYGDEIAIFLEGHADARETLSHVFIYITDAGKPDAKFRVHAYGKDSAVQYLRGAPVYFPGKELTDTDIVASGARGNEWVDVDFSKMHIPVHDGIFVSVEWALDYGNDDQMIRVDKYPHYYISAGNHSFNGQVLGLTLNYGVQLNTFMSFNGRHEWTLNSPVGAMSRTGPFRTYHWFNAMIYATCSVEAGYSERQ